MRVCARCPARSCQSMNYLAAMLLLVLGRDEENAFWVLACLIDDQDEGACVGWRRAINSCIAS